MSSFFPMDALTSKIRFYYLLFHLDILLINLIVRLYQKKYVVIIDLTFALDLVPHTKYFQLHIRMN